jgi:hypothetical protein
MKIFDSTATNSGADIATMARRRAAAATGATPATAGSNVYVSFDGLAELLRGSQPLVPSTTAPRLPVAAPSPKKPIDVTKWPKMDLATFCDQFDIPNQLQNKLVNLCIQGPHALCWIKDQDLREEGGLALGELGTLRDAEQRWKNFCTWDN